MSYCSQATITDAAFEHLRGIHTLDVTDCNPYYASGHLSPLRDF